MNLIKLIDTNNSEKIGKNIYNNNNFYKSLVDLMENKLFNNIINKYWSNDIEIKAFVIYIQIYRYLTKNYNLTPYKKILIIKYCMNNSKTRSIIIEAFTDTYTPNLINLNKKIK